MCELIFDVAANRPIATLAGACVCLAGLVVVLALRKTLATSMPAWRVLSILAIAGIVFAGIYVWDLRRWHAAVLAAEQRGVRISGIVEDFVAEPKNGHAPPEQFVVGNWLFRYSYYYHTPFFSVTAAHGGPLASGKHVKIVAVGENIARLEVCSP